MTKESSKAQLANPTINIKLKLAALWTSLMFLYIYGDYFELYAPKKVENLINGTALLETPTMLFIASFMIAIPALMIALTVLLKPKIIRFLSIFFGILFIIIVALVISTAFYPWYAFYVFYGFLEILVCVAIVRYAWKWPREMSS